MGLYLRKDLKGGGSIAVWEITETEKELLDILARDEEDREEELEEISLYKSEQARRERLSVLALLQTLFEDPVHIGHHENGAPYIEQHPACNLLVRQGSPLQAYGPQQCGFLRRHGSRPFQRPR